MEQVFPPTRAASRSYRDRPNVRPQGRRSRSIAHRPRPRFIAWKTTTILRNLRRASSTWPSDIGSYFETASAHRIDVGKISTWTASKQWRTSSSTPSTRKSSNSEISARSPIVATPAKKQNLRSHEIALPWTATDTANSFCNSSRRCSETHSPRHNAEAAPTALDSASQRRTEHPIR